MAGKAWKGSAITTEEDAIRAVRSSGDALRHVPWRLRTPAVCAEAIRSGCMAVRLVPSASRTHWFWTQVAGRLPLAKVPSEERTEDLCLAAASADLSALLLTPMRLRTDGFYAKAVGANPRAMRLVPASRRRAVSRLLGGESWVPAEVATLPDVPIVDADMPAMPIEGASGVCALWMDAGGYARGTKRVYGIAVRLCTQLIAARGGRLLNEAQAEALLALPGRAGRKRAAGTVAYALQGLRSLLFWAAEHGYAAGGTHAHAMSEGAGGSVAVLAECFGHTLSPAEIRDYGTALEGLPEESVENICRQLAATASYRSMPGPGRLRAMVEAGRLPAGRAPTVSDRLGIGTADVLLAAREEILSNAGRGGFMSSGAVWALLKERGAPVETPQMMGRVLGRLGVPCSVSSGGRPSRGRRFDDAVFEHLAVRRGELAGMAAVWDAATA